MSNVSNDMYLENTENILSNYDKTDKLKILYKAHTLVLRSYKPITVSIFDRIETNFKCTLKKAAEGVNEALLFYLNNLPVGFKRLPNVYEICNKKGMILNFNRRTAKCNLNHKGYNAVTLHYMDITRTKPIIGTSVHRYIALVWIPNPRNVEQVNHIDGIKTNNDYTNLEWVTNRENLDHAKATGLYKTEAVRLNGRGSSNSQTHLVNKDILLIRRFVNWVIRYTIRYLAKDFNVSIDIIYKILKFLILENIPRYRIPLPVLYSRKSNRYVIRNLLCCKNSNEFIRSAVNKAKQNAVKKLHKKFKVSEPTIRDIIALRTWQYDILIR